MVDNNNPNNPGNPNDPYRSEMPQYSPGYGAGSSDFDAGDASQGGDIETGMPSVANAPGRALGLIGIGAAVIFGVIFFFFSGEEPKKNADVSVSQEKEKARVNQKQATPPPPPSPVPLPVVVPPPPTPTAVPPPPPPPVPSEVTRIDQKRNQQQAERRKSSIVAFGGRGGNSGVKASKKKEITGFPGKDPNMVFSREYLGGTAAEQAEATIMGNLNYMIAQGKVIDAVLETAINTDLPGSIRAIVSRDIYAESGREVLIPKGSRLIGSYNAGLKRGQTRVYVVWVRVIRPDGIDIRIDSPGIDQLGRAGIEGYVDNKYFEMFTAAFLTSSITVALGIASDQLLDDSGTTSTQTSDGTTSSSGSAGSQAVLSGINDFSDTTEDILKDILDQEPTITIDQGTRVKVFVNRDLIMPPTVLEQSRFIQ